MEPKLEGRLIVALKIGSCALFSASLILAIVRLCNTYKCCDPVLDLPQLNLATLDNVPSADFKSLVGFSGYLKFSRDDKQADQYSYLKLNLNAVHLEEQVNKTQTLTLRTNCANITLSLKAEQVIVAKSIKIDLANFEAEHIGSCSSSKLGIVVRPNNSYFCYSKREYFCEIAPSYRKSHLVSLVVDALRFELDGNAELIGKRQFSKPAEFCF